jgi:hypothetical protein
MCGGGGLCLSVTGAELRILYKKQFLDERCGIQKNCWFGVMMLENEVKINNVMKAGQLLCDSI